LGNLHKSYDEDPSARFPVGYQQDITLIEPDGSVRIEDISCPAKKWYVDNGQNLQDTIYILGPGPRIEGHPLPQIWGERIGEGILCIQGKMPKNDRLKASKSRINDLVNRCYVWRPLNEFDEEDAWSGAPVILRHENGTERLLGFQSFVQPSDYDSRSRPNDDHEPKLRDWCKQGRISFAACMMPGNELLTAKIL
jgi:hypothetical protein